ncbi:MAG TPA: MFS transporter [Burkholderiales bacterium]|jgi:MFS family permease|nr:MFS transporter [Burkholderiales bacterium]
MSIYLIVLLCTLSHSGFGGSRIAISLYALDLGATQFTVGVLMALYAICPLLLAVYVGRLADRVGPRIPMLIGTIGVMVGLLVPPLFPGMIALYASALVLGSTFHFFFITVQGIAGGIGGSENRARNFALVGMGFSAAGFVGPFLAGVAIDHLGHRAAFLVLSVFPLVPILVLWLKPEFLPKARKRAASDAQRSALDLWQDRTLRKTFIASGIISSAWDLFQFYFPVYGHSVGLSASAIGAILGVFALATFVIRVFLSRVGKRYTEAQVLTAAIFIAAFTFALFPFFQNPYVLAAIAFVLGLGVGCGQPMSMSLIYAMAPPGRQAEAAGLRVTVNNFMHLVIPLLFGSLGTAFGYVPVFVCNSALLVAGGMLMRRARIVMPATS